MASASPPPRTRTTATSPSPRNGLPVTAGRGPGDGGTASRSLNRDAAVAGERSVHDAGGGRSANAPEGGRTHPPLAETGHRPVRSPPPRWPRQIGDGHGRRKGTGQTLVSGPVDKRDRQGRGHRARRSRTGGKTKSGGCPTSTSSVTVTPPQVWVPLPAGRWRGDGAQDGLPGSACRGAGALGRQGRLRPAGRFSDAGQARGQHRAHSQQRREHAECGRTSLHLHDPRDYTRRAHLRVRSAHRVQGGAYEAGLAIASTTEAKRITATRVRQCRTSAHSSASTP